MIEQRLMERQRGLFPAEMNWHELPIDVRRQVTALLATLCIELVDEPQHFTGEEQFHEPTENQAVAFGAARVRVLTTE
jgi:hypothetical protein